MYYQVMQDVLTSLINCITISGGAIVGLNTIYQHRVKYRQQQLESQKYLLQPAPLKIQETQQQLEESSVNEILIQSSGIAEFDSQQQQLRQAQQKLEQADQHKLQLQANLDRVKYELQQSQQEDQENQRQLCQLQQQLSSSKEQLEQAHQHKLQLQANLDRVKYELQQSQQEEQQNQRQLCQLQQQLASSKEQLRQAKQELETTKAGLQGFVNRLFYLDRSAKSRFNDLLLNKELTKAIQPASE